MNTRDLVKEQAEFYRGLANSESGFGDILPVTSGDMKPGEFYGVSDMRFSQLQGKTPGRKLANGQIDLANEEFFTAANYSEPLTAYTVGWTDPVDIEALTNFICGRVPVGRRFEYKSAVNAEALISDGVLNEDARAIGAEFKQMQRFTGTSINSATVNRGLSYLIDVDAEGVVNTFQEQQIVGRMIQRLKRNQYRRAQAALLTATGSASAKTWSSTSPEPVEDVRALADTAQTSSGIRPNRVLFNRLAWSANKKGQNALLTAGSVNTYLWTPQQFAEDALGTLDSRGMISDALYQSAVATKAFIATGIVSVFIAQDAPGRDDPTNVKRFVTPLGDGDFRVYRTPKSAKFILIEVEMYDSIEVTASVGAAAYTCT
jgi:hypothetical protein